MENPEIDDFEDLSGWSAITSGEAQLAIASGEGPVGKAMRLDFDFKGGGGFVGTRKRFALEIPEAYSFSLQVRGAAPANIFEFKLVDVSGQNVWRYRVEAFDWPADWQRLEIRSSQIDFAWGPVGGGPAQNIADIELIIAAGPGGAGTVEFSGLGFRDDTYRATPVVTASSVVPGHEPHNVLPPLNGTCWRSDGHDGPQWLQIDFQQQREFGGLIIDWEPGYGARAFEVGLSADGSTWKSAYATTQSGGERNFIYLPQALSRYVRLDLHESLAGKGFGIRGVEVKPFDFSRSLNTFFESIARHYPEGFYPKYLLGRQTCWTPVGTGVGDTQALFNEEGMVEVDKGSFSIEPFVYVNGQLLSWADASLSQSLERGYLPIPCCQWQLEGLRMTVTAFAAGGMAASSIQAEEPDGSALYLRYRIQNTATQQQAVRLFSAIRPFQVTPTWQNWRAFGGVAEIRELEFRDGVVRVNGNKTIHPLSPAQGFGAVPFARGPVTEFLALGTLPEAGAIKDEFGHGSGALVFDLDLEPGATEEVFLAVPFGYGKVDSSGFAPGSVSGPECFRQAVDAWERMLGTVRFRLPAKAQHLADTFRTAAAHILVNRDGLALHPGPRRYNRAWMRDGVLMGAALARAGCSEPLRDFMRWYAQFQTEEGNFPDCADREGTEWLPEFDAYGQFIYGIVEYWRFSGETAFLGEMWPAVAKTLGYMETLRARRQTPAYETPEKRACFGLLPESMSHEGYMAHPVHAYWDDFWALRGLKDAQLMAMVLEDADEALRLAGLRDHFCRDLYASLDLAIAGHGIDFVPGSVEFGDFDPAATAIALTVADELHRLPRPAIDRTYDRYMAGFRGRASGTVAWNNYSAYEIRIVGALLRLGRRGEALELTEYLLADQRIPAWNQWPEISWRDPKGPSFIGDLPHSWIGGEYILAVRSLFAYEREADDSLVVAAGIAQAWLADGFEVAVGNLPTVYGKLSYSLRLAGEGRLHLAVRGDLALPAGGIVAKPPLERSIRRVEIDGREYTKWDAESVTLRSVPAEVTIHC